MQAMLASVDECRVSLEWVDSCKAGLEAIKEDQHDLYLVDLHLGDGSGLDILRAGVEWDIRRPLIMLTSDTDRGADAHAAKAGAADYLIKGHFDAAHLERAIRHALERQTLLNQLRDAALVDDLTGILNRRGFMNLAEQALATADRTRTRLEVLFIDLDNMKAINDSYGHDSGNRALRCVGTGLRDAVRRSDIVGRLGGDEFAILAHETGVDHSPRLTERIRAAVAHQCATLPFPVNISIGVSHCGPGETPTMDDLLSAADRAMYREKTGRRPSEGNLFS
jgi:diguanylate cyclase (GGDEF)-like protein